MSANGLALLNVLVQTSATLFLLGLVVSTGVALAFEEPRYEVEQGYDGLELRAYAPRLVAETTVKGNFGEVGNRAFRILADYIGGENRQRQDIAMTAPVTQEPTGERIAMTAPVTQQQGRDGASWAFAFVMPAEYTLETLPEPLDPRIRIRRLPARHVAALHYSGFWSERRYRAHEARLLRALRAAGLEPAGAPVFARYDPPWTPWFLRRNEVLVPVTLPATPNDDSHTRGASR